MKFSPETLLQIYLDGSFTEEAQAEFDALMRKDPAFSQRVTQAISDRLGPVPDASVDAIASRLDAKAQDLWVRHKPSPALRNLKLALKGLAALSLAAGGYWGFHQWTSRMSVPTAPAGVPAPETTRSAVENVHSKSSMKHSGEAKAQPPVEEEAVVEDTRTGTAHGDNAPRVDGLPVVPAKSGPNSAKGDSFRVAIRSDKDTQALINIYDANGNLVRRLFQGNVQAGDRYVDWDGKNDLGVPVSPGAYNVVLDLNGKKQSGVLKILPK
jgi:hypothetical protein